MKPIGQPSGLDAVEPLDTLNTIAATGERFKQLERRTGSSRAARIEDILAALPSTSKQRKPASKASAAPAVAQEFTRQLNAYLQDTALWKDTQAAAASALQQFANIEFVGWHTQGGQRIGQEDRFESLTTATAEVSAADMEIFQAIIAKIPPATSVETLFDGDEQCAYVAVNVRGLNGNHLVGRFGATSIAAASQQVTAMEFAAARLSEWFAVSQQELAVRNSLHVAALVELLGKLAAASSIDAAAKCLTNELQRYFGAAEVSLGLCQDRLLKCRLAATSGVPDVDAFSDSCRLKEAVLQESIARSTASIWPAQDSANRHSLLSHQHFAENTRRSAVVSTPLRSADGVVVGAIVATFDDRPSAERAVGFLFAAERGIATSLAATTHGTQGYFGKLKSGIRRAFRTAKFKMLLACVGIAAAVMFIPVDYRVTCDSELQPVSRRFIAAPFAAPLDECLVEPGDVVEVNQLLALLDGRELRWELAGIRADLAKATKEHNAHLSTQEFGEAAIARHEIDRLQNQAALLEQRTQNLEIRSPIAGVIVAGDLKDTEGVPLETGQSLFEVAPLDCMVIEVSIPEADVWHVQPDMSLRLRLDALPSETVDATILRIHPRAELRNHENVFVAEAELDNTDRRLRPGMRGDAKVSTGQHFLGWNLFHKPVAYVTGWLGW